MYVCPETVSYIVINKEKGDSGVADGVVLLTMMDLSWLRQVGDAGMGAHEYIGRVE